METSAPLQLHSFGQRLQQLRKQAALTQVDLSQRVHLSKSYISFLESGERHPSREVVLRLADILLSSDQEAIRDELLMLAGFVPENPQRLASLNLTIGEPDRDDASFRRFLHRTLQLIREGHHQQAKSRIEEGFRQYQRPAELQTLLAHLELVQGRFEQAVLLQQTALQHDALSETASDKGLGQVDLILNLGVMYFLWGDHLLFGEPAQPEQAQHYYAQALMAFEKGLALEPDQVYLLDEAARVHFNLADLADSVVAGPHWQAAIDLYRQVLQHPQRRLLSQRTLQESTAFLALAYARFGEAQQGLLILDILSLNLSTEWLIPYIRACCACLAVEQGAAQALLSQAWEWLQEAIRLDGQAREQAQLDRQRDLKLLALQWSDEFEKVVKHP